MAKLKRKKGMLDLPEVAPKKEDKASPLCAVIMAGGSGVRFWPLSRKEKPKQCLAIYSSKPLITETVERFSPLIPKKDIFISTNTSLEKKLKPLVPGVGYIIEPHARNTAPAIGLSCIHLLKKGKDPIIVFSGSDYFIPDKESFADHLKAAVAEAEKDAIVVLGIVPKYPATTYGYIQRGATISTHQHQIYRVQQFVEKPDLEKAKMFVESHNYFWNSGMFIAKASVMLREIKTHMPLLHEGLMKIQKAGLSAKVTEAVFRDVQKIAIDYGVMERSQNVVVIEGRFVWEDVGLWSSLGHIKKTDLHHNVVEGNVVMHDTHNSVVIGGKRVIATLGLDGIVIVDTPDALLVCSKESASKIKEIYDHVDEKYK